MINITINNPYFDKEYTVEMTLKQWQEKLNCWKVVLLSLLVLLTVLGT